MVSDREPTQNGPDRAKRYRAEIARLNRTTDREIEAVRTSREGGAHG